MDEQTPDNAKPTPDRVRIAGQTLGFYWNAARIPALIAAVVNMILIITDQPPIYLWGVYLVVFVGLAFWLRTKKILTFGSAVTLGACAGLFAGLLVAVFRLVWERKLFLVFNIITEPLLTAAGGFILSALAVSVVRPRPPSQSRTTERRPDIRKEVNRHA